MTARRWTAAIAGVALGSLLGVTAVLAQSGGAYTVTWWSTPGGGGTSTQGQFILTGAIGQPFSAELTGGTYNVQSGFFAGSVVRYRLFMPLVASDN